MKILGDVVLKTQSLILLVLLNPIGLFTRVTSIPQFSTKVEDDLGKQQYRELTTEIIFSLQQYSLGNNIFTADTDVHDQLGHLDGKKIHEKLIPAVVFGKKKAPTIPLLPPSTNDTIKPSSSRFSSSKFVHINVQLVRNSKWKWKSGTQFDPHWKKLYSLTMGMKSEFEQLPERSCIHDYFLNFQNSITTKILNKYRSKTDEDDNLDYFHRRTIRSFRTRGGGKLESMMPENIIWIQMKMITNNDERNSLSINSEKSPSSSLSSLWSRDEDGEVSDKSNGSKMYQNVPDQFYAQFLNHSHQVSQIGQEEEEESENLRKEMKFFLTCDESCILQLSNIYDKNETTILDPLNPCSSERNDYLIKNSRSTACILNRVASKMKFPVTFSPLTFDTEELEGSGEIFKRNVDSKFLENYGKSSTLYNSLVFIAKKRFNTTDTTLKPFTWAGWLAIVLACGAAAINFMKILTMTNSDQSWYDFIVQQMLEVMHDDKSARKKFFRSSVGSSDVSSENNSVSQGPGSDEVILERGKASKALLHGTIRIVSFVMVAIYEGKLYNTITFPKSQFVSTFDELLTNDNYALKISREAAHLDFLMGSKNQTLMNRFSQSFNIEDCINWVEHSVSHGCVAYDFEFSNLPKAHKVRVLNDVNIFAKSKTSILNFSFRHYKPSYPFFHPAAQISRWILEAGIFQFWMIAENFFTENLIPSRITKRKFFNIKDYLGLFAIYLALLILAIFIFMSEIIVNWFKRKFEERSLVDFILIFWTSIKKVAIILWQTCVQVKTFFVMRQKCCLKIKRIVNNIV